MNKYLVTILILALILCSVFGGIVVADATTTNSASDIHLINPSSTAVIGDTLYIADNVTDNSCVVLSFDISGSTPTYNGMQEYEGNICIMRAYNDILYILFEDKYLEWNGTSTISYSVSIQDIAILSYEDTTYKYTISDNTVYRDGVDKWQADSLVIIDYTLYLLYDGTSASLTLVSGNSVNEPNTAGYTDSTYSYMTTNGTILAYSSSNSVLVDTTAVDTQLDNINSVILHGDDVLVLHNNQLTQYTLAEGIYSQGYTIGSDTVSIDVPSLDDITGYTLVQSTGYPTNIVYKTTYSTSIASLIELDSQTVLILEYEGSQDNSYYYVYTDNGFGWIKKATTTLAEEGTLSIIDTSLNTTTNYTAKLISANGVTIYHLPDTD